MSLSEKVEKKKRENLAAVHTYTHTSSFNEQIKNEVTITLVALVVTILFSYDEKLKFSNSKGSLLQTI